MAARRKLKVSVRIAWYDLWIGAYWDRSRHVLYVCPLPTLLIAIGRLPKETGLPPVPCTTVWMRAAQGGPRPWVCAGGLEGDGHTCVTFRQGREVRSSFEEVFRRTVTP